MFCSRTNFKSGHHISPSRKWEIQISPLENIVSCPVSFLISVIKYMQGGQNVWTVQIFFNPEIVRIVRIFFKLYGLYGFLSWKYTVFFIFTNFSKFFMKISKKNSRQNEVSLTFFLHSK